MKAILSLKNLSCGYREPLFSPLEIELHKGESIAVIGQSGVGKTTLITTILGIQKPKSGKVEINGIDIAKLSFKKLAALRSQNIGVIFQSGELLSRYSALENVMLPRLLWNLQDQKVEQEARTLLRKLAINSDSLAGNLSGGETQRVALACALINKPDLVLADEPTGSLDMVTRDVVADLLFSETKARGAALLVVTHDPTVAARADRVISLG